MKQLKAPKGLSLILYGIRTGGFHAKKKSILESLEDISELSFNNYLTTKLAPIR